MAGISLLYSILSEIDFWKKDWIELITGIIDQVLYCYIHVVQLGKSNFITNSSNLCLDAPVAEEKYFYSQMQHL